MTQKPSLYFIITGIIFIFAYGAFITIGGIINTDNNIANGLYWKVDKPLTIGRYVTFCPPNQPVFQDARSKSLIASGSCPDNYATLFFKIVAKRKALVTINDEGVTIDNVLIPDSKPQTTHKNGQALPKIYLDNYELKDNEILLLAESADSPYDSRYFGPVDFDQIDSVIVPIIQW